MPFEEFYPGFRLKACRNDSSGRLGLTTYNQRILQSLVDPHGRVNSYSPAGDAPFSKKLLLPDRENPGLKLIVVTPVGHCASISLSKAVDIDSRRDALGVMLQPEGFHDFLRMDYPPRGGVD